MEPEGTYPVLKQEDETDLHAQDQAPTRSGAPDLDVTAAASSQGHQRADEPDRPLTKLELNQRAELELRRLYVSSLSWETSDDCVKWYFHQFGELEDVSVIRDRSTGRSKGYAFIRYASPEAAQRSLAQQTHTLDGRQLGVRLAKPKSEKPHHSTPTMARNDSRALVTTSSPSGGGPSGDNTSGEDTGPGDSWKFYVRNISYDVTDEEFRSFFETRGELVVCNVVRESDGRCRGYGFVKYANQDVAEQLLDDSENPGLQLQGRKLVILISMDKMAKQRKMEKEQMGIPVDRVFAAGFPDETTSDQLRDYFRQFGPVKNVNVIGGKGYGFVEFKRWESADRALQHKGHQFLGSRLDVRLPKRKGQLYGQTNTMGGPPVQNNRGMMGGQMGGQMQQSNLGGGYMQQNQQMGYQPSMGMQQQNMGGMQMNNNMGMQGGSIQTQSSYSSGGGGGGYQPYSGGGMANQSSFTVANPGYSPQRSSMATGGQIGNVQSNNSGRPAQRRAWI